MFRKEIKPKKKNHSQEVDYWLSYSDLMAGVLIIFILLFTYNILAYNQSLEQKEAEIKELTKLREMIIMRLFEEFGDEIEIDPQTGIIKLKNDILFDYDDDELRTEGQEFLQEFIPRYLEVLLGDEDIRDNLAQIVVEGHTDDIGSYIYNLELSQARAYSVVEYIYSEDVQSEYQEVLKEYIAAIGRSKIDLVTDESGEVIRDESRRVEFKFELDNEKILEEILRQVE